MKIWANGLRVRSLRVMIPICRRVVGNSDRHTPKQFMPGWE